MKNVKTTLSQAMFEAVSVLTHLRINYDGLKTKHFRSDKNSFKVIKLMTSPVWSCSYDSSHHECHPSSLPLPLISRH